MGLSEEMRTGAVTSAVAGFLSFGILVLLPVLGASRGAAALASNALGSAIGYALDVVFAAGKTGAAGFLPSFTRFCLLTGVDIMVISAASGAISRRLDRAGVRFKWRDEMVVSLCTAATFVLCVNYLRFSWAYKDAADPLVDSAMVVLFSALLARALACPAQI